MDVFGFIFGNRPRAAVISAPPEGVTWRYVRARPDLAVRAHIAARDGVLRSRRGRLRYRAGEDYIVVRRDGERSVASRDVFERTYQKRADGRWEKRTDIRYRYFTLAKTVIVATAEGPQRADPGDWIMEGVNGELWPIAAARAQRLYVADAQELTAGEAT